MRINTVTVVGANGTMGANVSAIFAAFANAKVYMVCRDMEKAAKAVAKAGKSVRADSISANLIPADYSMLAKCIEQSELVFESAAENLEIKLDITKKIARSLREDAVACSGTSGLSVTTLAECFPEKLRGRYMGVHFFNPPYNMPLCELIPTKYTDMNLLKEMEQYLSTALYRTVALVRDAPAFLANRIGFQFINEAMQLAEQYKNRGGIDYIDSIFGSFTGRAMAPLTTADFVGMDVHKAIVENLYQNTFDFAHDTFVLPTFAQKLIDEGLLGRKACAGLYKMEVDDNGRKNLMVYDIASGSFRLKVKYPITYARAMNESLRNGDYRDTFAALIHDRSDEAEICLGLLLKYIVYSLYTVEQVGYNVHAADAAMAAGFNWCPPLAMADAFSSVCDLAELVKERLDPQVLTCVDVDKLLQSLEPSDYDYRPYFKVSK